MEIPFSDCTGSTRYSRRPLFCGFCSTNHSTANHKSLKLLYLPCFRSDSNEIRNLSFFCQVPLNRAVIFWFFSTNQPITAQPIIFSLKLLPFPCFRSDFNEIRNLSFFCQVPLNRGVIFWFFSTNHSTANHTLCNFLPFFLPPVKRTIIVVIFFQIFKASP